MTHPTGARDATNIPAWLSRLTVRYWGRVLLLTAGVGAAFLAFGLLDPQLIQLKFLGLAAVVIVVSAARNARQLRISTIVPCAYLGSRIRWTIEEPTWDNLVLFALALALVVLLLSLAFTFKEYSLMLGWLRLADGQELPLVLAPCSCRKTDLLHYQAFSLGKPVQLDPEGYYKLHVPSAPRRLRVNLALESADGQTYLRTLDAAC